jgi:hypothetical protein
MEFRIREALLWAVSLFLALVVVFLVASLSSPAQTDCDPIRDGISCL